MKPLALALLVVAGQAWRASTAPGPSSKGHEAIAGNCDACHMPFKGLPNEKCVSCHKDLGKFHATVAAQKCNACHSEHKGPQAPVAKPAALKSFDHALTGMPLIGAHAKLKCAQCHSKPMAQLQAGTCATCHKDPHAPSLGTGCVTCHTATAWKPATKTKEQHLVSMQGGHLKLDCAGCHLKGEHLQKKVACGECHERAHGGTTAPCDGCHQVAGWKPAKFDHAFCTCTLPQKHATVPCLGCHQDFNFKSAPQLCSGCHEKERKHESLGECSLCHSAVSWKKNTFDHNKRSKFKLTGQHLEAACESCHVATGKFRGVPSTCESCHAKDGEKAHGDFGPCTKCHTTEGFQKSTFDHASTGFPLTGQHAKVNCRECHGAKAGPKKAELGFSFTPMNAVAHTPASKVCSGCHLDPHGGATAGSPGPLSHAPSAPSPGAESPGPLSHAPSAPSPAAECNSCHTTQAFKPTTFTVDRHATTKFPLTGKHATTDCKLCHTDLKLNDAPQQCAACHVDRHGGKLGTSCEQCHGTKAFKPAVGFDHAKTGFALTGGHAKVSCAGCHEGRRGEAMAASTTPAACATCHQPQHGDLGADCAQCHDPEKGPFHSARGMTFAHQVTGFTLDRRHATLRCGACHVTAKPKLEDACVSCHEDVHSGQLGRDCDTCHRPDRWRLVRFDHDRTAWPLRGRHFVTACNACHTGQRWVGLTDECHDCHAADAARGKARVPAAHPFGQAQCTDCHTSFWTW